MGVRLGNGNWAVKTSNLLAYNDASGMFFNKEFDFTRATTATRVNKSGLMETVSINVPRIDFLNDTKGHLLLEPASTNLLTYSEDFSQSFWNLSNVTTISNSGVSPQGANNATLINEGTVNSFHWLRPIFSIPNSANITVSFFAKKVTRSFVTVNIFSGVDSKFIFYNIENGSVVNPQSGVTTSVEDFGNGWFRCSYTRETAATGNPNTVIGLSNGLSQGYVGENKEILLWGVQLEQQSFATSYVPTSGSSVTRNAEVCNNSGAAQDFNSTEGVLYFEGSALVDAGELRKFGITDGVKNSNGIFIYYHSTTNYLFFQKYVNSVRVVNQSDATYNQLDNLKIAIRYNSTSFDVFINGVKVYNISNTDTFAANILNRIDFTEWRKYHL